jgi:hypothetical protein
MNRELLTKLMFNEVEIAFIDNTKMVGEITSQWAPPIEFTEKETEQKHLLFPETIKSIKL